MQTGMHDSHQGFVVREKILCKKKINILAVRSAGSVDLKHQYPNASNLTSNENRNGIKPNTYLLTKQIIAALLDEHIGRSSFIPESSVSHRQIISNISSPNYIYKLCIFMPCSYAHALPVINYCY